MEHSLIPAARRMKTGRIDMRECFLPCSIVEGIDHIVRQNLNCDSLWGCKIPACRASGIEQRVCMSLISRFGLHVQLYDLLEVSNGSCCWFDVKESCRQQSVSARNIEAYISECTCIDVILP